MQVHVPQVHVPKRSSKLEGSFERIFSSVRKAICRVPHHSRVCAVSLLDNSHSFGRGREISMGLKPDLHAIVFRLFCKTSNALRYPVASGIAVRTRLYFVSKNANAC